MITLELCEFHAYPSQVKEGRALLLEILNFTDVPYRLNLNITRYSGFTVATSRCNALGRQSMFRDKIGKCQVGYEGALLFQASLVTQ